MPSDLDTLLQELIDNERTEALAITLRGQPSGQLRVAPLLSAARPLMTAAVARQVAQPIVYVVGNSDAAMRACNDLVQWLDPASVLLFPASDALAYEQMSPGINIVASRLKMLRRLHDHRPPTTDQRETVDTQTNAPLVIVAPIKALLQPILSPQEWADSSLRLAQGQEHNLDELLRRWIDMGYRTAPTVEEPGEVNRRGGIIDIFPPGDELPLRIEFFGDEVDSMRRFDPITQRSQERLREVLVGPPNEVPLWNHDAALARLRALPVDTLRQEARDEWNTALDRLEHGERFEGRAFFAPFFRQSDTRSTLLDHLPNGAAIIFSEQMLIAQHAIELHEQAEARRATLIDTGELPSTFPRPYVLWNELIERARQHWLVDLSNNDLEVSAEFD